MLAPVAPRVIVISLYEHLIRNKYVCRHPTTFAVNFYYPDVCVFNAILFSLVL